MNLINLLTDVAVVADAIRFISRKFKGNIESAGNNDDDKESNERDYDEDLTSSRLSIKMAWPLLIFIMIIDIKRIYK